MESLGYMLCYLYLGKLPWQDVKLENIENIKNLKQSIIDNKKLPEILENYLKYVKSLEYEEKPNYYLIIDKFKREIEILSKTN